MHTVVNLRTFFHGKIGGLGNVVRHLVKAIAEDCNRKKQPITIFVNQHEVDSVQEFAPNARMIVLDHETGIERVERAIACGKYDVLFCPLLTLEPLAPEMPSLLLIPDLQHEFYPEFFPEDILRWRYRSYRASALHADAITTISKHSKNTIVEKFNIDPSKITVIPLGVDREFDEKPDRQTLEQFKALRLPRRYLFYPANFWPHKNHIALLRAMQLIHRNCPEVGLVLTGSDSGQAKSVAGWIRDLRLQEAVRLLGYQPRPLLAEICRQASALVFVSKFEGFGLPLLEAFHTDTPVIASRSTSCPEVAEHAALFVDPDQPNEIAAAAMRVLEDPELVGRLVQAGRARRKHYSWDRAAKLTLDLLERIVTQPRGGRIEVREHPTVSIVTPSYNKAPFLEETIQSVLAQDYPYIDYVVMDGGSTDGSVQILEKYRDRLRYFSQPDRGQADAVNRGLSLSSGRICAFLNADDTYLPGAVSTAVRRMLRAPGMAVVYGEGHYVDEEGKIIGRYPTYPFDAETLSRNCYICQPSAFVWRDIFDKVGGLNAGKHFSLDYDLWLRISRKYPMLKIDDVLATSRMYSDNKTIRNRQKVYAETISSVREHCHYVPFDWIFGYACYLTNPKAPFFAPPPPTRLPYALALALGMYYNRQFPRRYLSDWLAVVGRQASFRGRWEDGWISKRYVSDFQVTSRASEICIKGSYPEFLPPGLTLSIRLNGKRLGQLRLRSFGPFATRLNCPESERGKLCSLEIRCSRTFRPSGTSADSRQLGCLIDSISCLEPE